MVRNFVTPAGPEQPYLVPPDVRDWLPARHLAWELLGLARRMDLAPFLAWYRADGQGRPAYHPGMMVALVCYCYCKGIRSSRAVEMATFDDVGARVICGNLHPDHATVARFLARHEEAVKGLLVVSVAECAREGLVSVDVAAGDGTKVRANASMARNLTLQDLDAQIAGLEELLAAEVDAWIAQARAEDARDDAADSGGTEAGGPAAGGGRSGPARPGRRAGQVLARRREARSGLEAEEARRREEAQAGRAGEIAGLRQRASKSRERADAEAAAADAKVTAWQRRAEAKKAAGSGKRPDGRMPAGAGGSAHVRRARQAAGRAEAKLADAMATPAGPGKPGKINTTDPSSKVMPAKHGGFRQSHNVQVLAGRRQVIYAILRHPSPVDVAALHPLLKQGRATLDAAGITEKIHKILFDAGYASDDNFTACCEGSLHVAVTREARQTGRLADGKEPATMKESWQQMAAKLATPDGKATYKQRSAIIEPVFAQLFARLGNWLNYRDGKADLELHLWAATHNMLKAIRAQHRRTARQPAAPAPVT
jgi:transposase